MIKVEIHSHITIFLYSEFQFHGKITDCKWPQNVNRGCSETWIFCAGKLCQGRVQPCTNSPPPRRKWSMRLSIKTARTFEYLQDTRTHNCDMLAQRCVRVRGKWLQLPSARTQLPGGRGPPLDLRNYFYFCGKWKTNISKPRLMHMQWNIELSPPRPSRDENIKLIK